MHAGTQGDPFKFYVNHNVGKIDDAVGLFTAAWRFLRRYSVNNTIPTLAVNSWIQFSAAYIAAAIITPNNLDFITAILNPKLMSVYALVCVIFGSILLASLFMKYMNKKEIKEESSIDVKIRGGKPGEISEIAESALRIEIIPDLSLIGHKKENFSIVLPISEEQSGILKNQEQENRNKIILLTIPYIIGGAIIIGALVQSGFSFANVLGWEEWVIIVVISAIVIAGIWVTLNKLRNNETNNKHNTILKFDNPNPYPIVNIFVPFTGDKIISVMEKKAEDQEKTDPLSRLEKLLTSFKDEIVDSFDKHLDEAIYLLDKKLLEPANVNIEKTLDGIGENIQETLENLKKIREDIKTDLSVLHGEISIILNDAKEFTGKVNSLDIEGTFSRVQNSVKNFNNITSILKNKMEGIRQGGVLGFFTGNILPNQTGDDNSHTEGDDNEFLGILKKSRLEVDKLKKEVTELKKSLKEARTQTNKRDSGTSCDSESSSNDSLNAKLAEEKQEKEKNRLLKSIERTEGLKKENAELEAKFAQQKETVEWKEKIYGEPSEFFNYVLKSIKLEGESEHGKIGTTLRHVDNKIIIHWKDGSETTCYIDRQGNLQVQPNTAFFVDPNIQAGVAVAVPCAG